MDNNKKVLVVEDDPGLQKQMKWAFEGFEVITAGDREEAVQLIIKHSPPVATVDLGLPPDPNGTTEGLYHWKHIKAGA